MQNIILGFFGLLTAFVLAIAFWAVLFNIKARTREECTNKSVDQSLHNAATITKQTYVELHGHKPLDPDMDTARFAILPAEHGSSTSKV